jgi:hypothetical protein
MKGKWAIWAALILAAILCVWVSFRHFHSSHVALPEGCDQFGYLYQAEAARDGMLLGEHTPRPFLEGLVAKLSVEIPNPRDYAFMIAPHAYHYEEVSGKVANQYPPGTALLFSIFPKEYRQIAYPAFMTLLLTSLLLVARRLDGWHLAAVGSLVILYAAAIMAVPGGRIFYFYVGSEAPVIPLLIAAGWLLRKSPLESLALVSATVLFRIADIWLLPLVALPVFFEEYFLDGERRLPTLRDAALCAAKIVAVSLACGIVWLLLYNQAYLGGPFSTAYPYYDRALASGVRIVQNLAYYFYEHPINAIINAVALAGVAILYCRKGRRWVIAWAGALVVWNYLFFVTHDVHAFYYPFASAYILFGLCLAGLDGLDRRFLPIATAFFALLAAVSLHAIWPTKKDRAAPAWGDFPRQVECYRNAFGKADVVWADAHSGTVEYAAGIPGFRPGWGSEDAAIVAIRWLAENGYRQAFYLDDSGMKPDVVLAVIRKSGMTPSIENNTDFGRIVWIEPVAKARQ